MKLFSDFVAADAEANQPVIKKEDPMKAPLHFKYYSDDGDEASMTEVLSDEILGEASHQLTKNKVDMKYDHSDPDWGVSPIKPVNYQKSQIDLNTLNEPIHTDLKPKDGEVVELTTS